MELRDADPTLLGLHQAVQKWDILRQEQDAVVKYLTSPDGIRGAPTMSVSVEAQKVLSLVHDPTERAHLAKALQHETGQDDATNTVAGLLREGASREELQGTVTRKEIDEVLDKLGYAQSVPCVAAVMIANKFGGGALATVCPV
jgi:hypothetical protein